MNQMLHDVTRACQGRLFDSTPFFVYYELVFVFARRAVNPHVVFNVFLPKYMRKKEKGITVSMLSIISD